MSEIGKELVLTDNEIIGDVVKRTGLVEGYVPLRGMYAHILKMLEEGGCHKHVNENHFYAACNKLKLLHKAKLVKTESKIAEYGGEYTKHKDGDWLPPKKVALKMRDSRDIREGIYMKHNGNWGIDTDNPELDKKFTIPVVTLLCEFNREMIKAEEEIKELSELAKTAGISTVYVTLDEKRQSLVRKFFGKNKKKNKKK